MWASRVCLHFCKMVREGLFDRCLLSWDRTERTQCTCMEERQGSRTAGINQTKPSSLVTLYWVIMFDTASQVGKRQLTRVFRSKGPWFSSKYHSRKIILPSTIYWTPVWQVLGWAFCNSPSRNFSLGTLENIKNLWENKNLPAPTFSTSLYSNR